MHGLYYKIWTSLYGRRHRVATRPLASYSSNGFIISSPKRHEYSIIRLLRLTAFFPSHIAGVSCSLSLLAWPLIISSAAQQAG